MEEKESREYFECPLTNAMRVIGGKWKIVIIGHLMKKTKRTGELKRDVVGITQKMLTQQLRELESDGVVFRKVYNEVPPKVEYSLTSFGRSLSPILKELWSFGEKVIERKNVK